MCVFRTEWKCTGIYLIYIVLRNLDTATSVGSPLPGKRIYPPITSFFNVSNWVVLVIDCITISVCLVNRIFGWNINAISVFSINTILRIKWICHYHAFLQIVLGKLQYNVRFLRYGWYYQICYANRAIFIFRTFFWGVQMSSANSTLFYFRYLYLLN